MIALLQDTAAAAESAGDSIKITRTFDWNHVSDRLIQVAIIVVASILVYHFVKLVVRRILSREIVDDDPLVKRLKEQRVQTIGGLFTNVLFVVMVTITTLTVLDVFINIGPLLASVSVIGLAVSFGAQSLVKDIISGTFMLIEGQFGIGDVVRVGEVSGLVEKMTLRTTVLRDTYGAVHVVPNGEIKLVSNLTKTWSRAVLDLNISHRQDIDQALAVLKNIAAEFQADPQFAPLLLEMPEVLGVENVTETGVVLRMMAKTLPLKQWEVARELRKRIHKRFDAEGIQIPFPPVAVHWGEGESSPLPSSKKT